MTWALQVLLGAMFIVLGTAKILDSSWARKFAGWGFPAGFHLEIGALELVGGIALLVPGVASYAAAGLIVIMVGASLTNLVLCDTVRPIPLLVVLAAFALLRRPSARGLT